MSDNRVKVTSSPGCPRCGKPLDGATCISETRPVQPSPGDLTVCLYCRQASVFTESLGLRRATKAEAKELSDMLARLRKN